MDEAARDRQLPLVSYKRLSKQIFMRKLQFESCQHWYTI